MYTSSRLPASPSHCWKQFWVLRRSRMYVGMRTSRSTFRKVRSSGSPSPIGPPPMWSGRTGGDLLLLSACREVRASVLHGYQLEQKETDTFYTGKHLRCSNLYSKPGLIGRQVTRNVNCHPKRKVHFSLIFSSQYLNYHRDRSWLTVHNLCSNLMVRSLQ